MPGTRMQEHSGNEKSIVWSAVDFADEQQKTEMFCARFASQERELLFISSLYQDINTVFQRRSHFTCRAALLQATIFQVVHVLLLNKCLMQARWACCHVTCDNLQPATKGCEQMLRCCDRRCPGVHNSVVPVHDLQWLNAAVCTILQAPSSS